MRLTLEKLEAKAQQARTTYNERLRRNYHLARELGFDTTEARLLSFTNEPLIRKLAQERQERQNDQEKS